MGIAREYIARVALLLCASGYMLGAQAEAAANLSAGVWGTYQYLPGDESNTNTDGEFTGEALIVYLDGRADKAGNWLYAAEMRFGPGSFTDPDNNATGDEFTLHKAWVGWQLGDNHTLRVGKSQVPFGWKTINFWPGDILLAGYGDQMDVGLKLSGEHTRLHYDLAYYSQDDWGGTSTDTVDDNGHWGSSDSYRKVQTWVANLTLPISESQRVGLSLQSGQLQDLSGPADKPTNGSHEAAALYYTAELGKAFVKALYIRQSRELPTVFRQAAMLPDTIENDRYALELGWRQGPWTFYLDASVADPDTNTGGDRVGRVSAFAPGASYDYGPGWIYIEYLWQDGFVDRNGQVGEGDFDALYVSLDFYL